MAIGTILGTLVQPIADLFKQRGERKAATAAAKAKIDEIHANAAANDSEAAAAIALVNAQNQNNTWKDEFALITIAAPFWTAMILGPLGYGDVVGEMFTSMASIPEFWQSTFQVGILSALGVTVLNKVTK